MFVLKKLDNTELAYLEESCSGVAKRNWDGYVRVQSVPATEHSPHSRHSHSMPSEGAEELRFLSYSEEGDLEATCAAEYVGFLGTHHIYAFQLEGAEESEPPVYLELVPLAIMGLLGL